VIQAGTAMPRVSQAQAAQNRDTILDASARLFRERGIGGVSVADLMADAGLTHGGFYGHFASKEALAAEACARAFTQSAERRHARIDALPAHADVPSTYAAMFLAKKNICMPGEGCPAVGLASDIARLPADAPARDAYAEGVEGMLQDLSAMDPSANREDVLLRLATLVGTVTLARATVGQPISDELLAAVRAVLAAPSETSG
jgi:TetR/AcrR family transcriptional repressor of nem operon